PASREAIHVETEVIPYALLQRFMKHFPCNTLAPLDRQVARTRAVKSQYELAIMERAGAIHRRALEDLAPALLHQGIARFGTFGSEIVLGQLGFGESSLYPTHFDGPGGCVGLEPAAPVLGSRARKLRKGDLVFVDIGCGMAGYHTDKTMTYTFGGRLPGEAIAMQQRCEAIERQLAAMLRPGAIPSEIYVTVMKGLDAGFLEHFMGLGDRRANFLGHGIGLHVDEPPAIAEGFDDPLEEGMVIALEPKRGVPGVGMVGIENTYLVMPAGGRSITGNSPGLIPAG
ncbi:MAG: M24 family metallopeptidase, partial [Verrucomicrobia bacterium]|nr:M24 family metallopeptidase [Verrucomicrobiota bacterium]